jgi:hypothetical protein
VRDQVLHSVVPALWPAAVRGLLLRWTSGLGNGTFLAVGVQAAAGAAVYYALFFGLAIGATDRRMYLTKARELLSRRPVRPVALGQPASEARS